MHQGGITGAINKAMTRRGCRAPCCEVHLQYAIKVAFIFKLTSLKSSKFCFRESGPQLEFPSDPGLSKPREITAAKPSVLLLSQKAAPKHKQHKGFGTEQHL